MKELLSKLSAKPDAEKDDHAEAKMQVLNELRSMAMDMMGSKVKDKLHPVDGMEQVSVAAPDKDGLKKGLDLASSLVPGADFAAEKHEDDPAEEADEDDMSPEEIDALIEELQAKKQALKA